MGFGGVAARLRRKLWGDAARRARRRSTSPSSRWRSPTSPAVTRIVWLFSWCSATAADLWARFVLHQDLQTVLRCHIAAFEAIGGVPREILYDRMKTAVIGEDGRRRHRLQPHAARLRPAITASSPKACRPYRAKTKGKVERPFRYIREDFFLGRHVPQPRRPERPARATGSTPSPTCACTPPPGGSSPKPSPRRSRSCRPLPLGAVRRGAQTGAPRLARGHGLGRRQSLQRPRRHPAARRRGAHARRRDPHLRGRRARSPPIPCSKGAASDGSTPAHRKLRVVAAQRPRPPMPR